MKNTCLYSYYEYMIRNVIGSGSDMPEYNARFQSAAADIATKGVNRKLEERKKEIWENTRTVLSEAARGERNALQNLISQEIQCALCVT